jgi:hypothetical protein
MSKKVWINYMLGHNKPGLDTEIFNGLLDPLTTRELKIMKKNEDLLNRVIEICKLTKMAMLKHIRDDYGFKIDDCQNGDLWIDASDACEGLMPAWADQIVLPHTGWYLSFQEDDDDFMPWARNLLLQEVRINMWMRYYEHKLDLAAASSKKNPFEVTAQVDVELPWNGYGNYL